MYKQGSTVLLVLFLGVLVETFYNAVTPWVPQLGTITYPKTPDLSKSARERDFVKLDGRYFRARQAMDFQLDPGVLEDLPEPGQQNEYWQGVARGTYVLPKIFGVDRNCDAGDIFYNDGTATYFRAEITAYIPYNWRSELKNGPDSVCSWVEIQATENWMTLLRPIIGDMRLGEITFASAHDAGTEDMGEHSLLVDNNFLLQLADELTQETLVNWSRTHMDKFDQMLLSGYRNFDLRVADMDEYLPGTFCWWHGISAAEITEGLTHLGDFARAYPEEIILLDMGHFAAPGDNQDPTVPIPEPRKDILSDMILATFGDCMVPKSILSDNPTMNEVLATGKNIITIMRDGYIQAKDDRYWPNVIHSAWTGRANPEELFEERSSKLKDFKANHFDEITDISGCSTPDEKTIIGGLINTYGDNETLMDILDDIFPNIREINPANMSFEGLWVDLVSMARYGTNNAGMHARPSTAFTSGSSVQYSGVNDQYRYWLARPSLYKPNIIGTDDFQSSTLPDTAILFNMGDIPREVMIAHQGNPMMGYFQWENGGRGTSGGTKGLECTAAEVRYTITSGGATMGGGDLGRAGVLTLQEGQYPLDSVIQVDVSSVNLTHNMVVPCRALIPLWSGIIQDMIDTVSDVYIRCTDTGNGGGFAYSSSTYNDYGVDCDLPPADNSNVMAYVEW